jgi:hypothetical protein
MQRRLSAREANKTDSELWDTLHCPCARRAIPAKKNHIRFIGIEAAYVHVLDRAWLCSHPGQASHRREVIVYTGNGAVCSCRAKRRRF